MASTGVMCGHHNRLTHEIDIYAFTICCVEILGQRHHAMAASWRFCHRSFRDRCILSLRIFILANRATCSENKRSTIPQTRFSSPTLTYLIHVCWECDSSSRPSFKHIVSELKQLHIKAGSNVEGHDSPRPPLDLWELMHTRPSPDMWPIPLPGVSGEYETQMSLAHLLVTFYKSSRY